VPDRQRAGIGSRLVREATERGRATGYPLIVVLGHPEYYPRFGFEPAAARGIVAPWEVPPEAWMVLPLPAYDPRARGVVTYAQAFDAVT
jgi:putative acetyltransferase